VDRSGRAEQPFGTLIPNFPVWSLDLPSASDLKQILERIDGRGYKTYADIRGHFELDHCTLFVDHVQGDPFAAPSKLRLRVPSDRAAIPAELYGGRVRRIALADFLARRVQDAIGATQSMYETERGGSREHARSRRGRRAATDGSGSGSGKSGLVFVDSGGQEVLERTAVVLGPDWIEARIEVGLPAAGRRVLGFEAEQLLGLRLPEIAKRALYYEQLDGEALRGFVECVENQAHMRDRLDALGLVAFVADGAILPRESGESERPMRPAEARRFESPRSARVEIDVPNRLEDGRSQIVGMGIRKGVTLIVGGGYHGKSTLLRALECCVYPHIPGDGREYVVASADLVKIRAEDGRAITGVDIHAFIDALPPPPGLGAEATPKRPHCFSTPDASGSTSQAANIIEAIEAGATGLLLDEDTSATNFMLRDARMQRLVDKEHEPITPFVDRVREIYDRFGVSTVLVMGGCGDYFDIADHVVMMRDYAALDVSEEARRIAADHPSGRTPEPRGPMQPVRGRVPVADSFDPSRGRRDVKITIKSRDLVLYGEQTLDLRNLSQLLDTSQTRAVAMAIHLASDHFMGGTSKGVRASAPTLADVLDQLEALLDEEGLDALDPYARERADGRHPGAFARPRRFEIAAAINRYRGLRLRAGEVDGRSQLQGRCATLPPRP